MRSETHPWRIMSILFGGVLLVSIALQISLSPAVDAALFAVEARRTTVTGVIGHVPSGAGRLGLLTGSSASIFTNRARARKYDGREVRITGVLHESARVIELRKIELVNAAIGANHSKS
jgi:hypothetical protein